MIALLLLAAVAGKPPEPARAVEVIKREVGALAPRETSAKKLVLGLAALAAGTLVDRELAGDIADAAPPAVHRFEPFGRYSTGNALGAALLVSGVVAGERQLRVDGLTAIEANLLTSWLVTGLQRLAGRARPGDLDAGEFRRGGSSFPSAHAGHAFAWAGVLYEAFPGWRGRWLFPALAGTVALSRVADREHFPTDVVAGGVIGWTVGAGLERAHRPSGKALLTLAPTPGGAGVAMSVRLP